jgi:hypothetical protein
MTHTHQPDRKSPTHSPVRPHSMGKIIHRILFLTHGYVSRRGPPRPPQVLLVQGGHAPPVLAAVRRERIRPNLR